ncbi:hypothetical protein HNR46_004278 [Haloferula luteola]|uniref:Uncharacterized protein n=1 Tax=Haloferula luteola TaxID=595692 RepID=A0A840VA91_9BACT|nr:hypothetical protein [Haloferula luteola]
MSWLIVAVAAIYFGLLGGWRDATLGRFHRKAFELFGKTEGISKVEVFLLMGEDADEREETFPIRPYGSDDPIYGRVELTGDELEHFLELWSYQVPSYWNQALCHEPAYGFRLYRGGRLVGETSICWECSNFYVTAYPGMSGWYGFIAESKSAKDLLAFCDARLPYKRSEPRPEENKAEQGGAPSR